MALSGPKTFARPEYVPLWNSELNVWRSGFAGFLSPLAKSVAAVPSLPGFGFSDKPTETGWNLPRIASAWSLLMQRLGYRRWVAQGGDWGAGVTTALGHLVPPGLAGIHLNWQFVFPTEIPEHLSFEEQRAVDGAKLFLGDGNGYFRQQATRPQTIGYALSDSPAGQAMWIYEKFYSWTDNNGSPEDSLSRDQMLDDISLY